MDRSGREVTIRDNPEMEVYTLTNTSARGRHITIRDVLDPSTVSEHTTPTILLLNLLNHPSLVYLK